MPLYKKDWPPGMKIRAGAQIWVPNFLPFFVVRNSHLRGFNEYLANNKILKMCFKDLETDESFIRLDMMIKRKKNKGEMNVTKGKWIRLTCLIEANIIL